MRISEEKSVAVSKDMYGLFFEDINYSLDGGLNADMIENGNFEAVHASGKKDDYTITYDGRYAWEIYEDDGSGSMFYMEGKEPLNEVNPHYLVLDGRGETPAVRNRAYDGIYLKDGMKYQVTFYAKALEGSRKVGVSVRKYGRVISGGTVQLEGDAWKKYSLELTATETIGQADFVLSLEGSGKVAFDYVSMIPEDAVLHIFRKDLADHLKALKPSFLRFPGGCIVEGNTLENRYQWKDTIGPVEERKFNWNRWAVHANPEETGFSGYYPHYGQTYKVGYYEYFLLCEYIGAKALPVMNVGLACQFMSSEKVDVESKTMQEYIEDALDLIEFANGGADTKWGRKRVEMGHEEPFGLEYLGIGNEQWQTDEIDFYGRYERFEKAIHAKYPEMKLIGSCGPDVTGGGYFRAWDWARETRKKNDNLVYAMDEHYYVAPEWLYDHVHFYDSYDREIKVFAGEYACHIPGLAGRMNCPEANTLGAALAEAAFMTGLEKNADVVVLASYAPLFARMGYAQWSPNLIWFDGETSFVTPSYYVQQLYSVYRGVRTLDVDITEAYEKSEQIYMSATEGEDGSIFLKVVNAGNEAKEIEIAGEGGVLADGQAYTVHYFAGRKEDGNFGKKDKKVTLQQEEGKINGKKISVAGNSFSVFVFEK